MIQQLKSTIKGPPKTKHVMVKMSPEEYAVIYSKSRQVTDGNVSAYMRKVSALFDMKWLTELQRLDERSLDGK